MARFGPRKKIHGIADLFTPPFTWVKFFVRGVAAVKNVADSFCCTLTYNFPEGKYAS